LRKTVALCGNEPEAPRFRLAQLLAEQGRWDEARLEFEPLLAAKPDFAPALLLAARRAHAQNDLDQSISMARRCLDDPRTARSAWFLLGTLLRLKGDAASAEDAVRKAASAPPDEPWADPFEAEAILSRGDPRVLCEKAHPLLAAGKLESAAALIDRLERQHPNYAETWLLVGRLQLLRKNPAAAETAFRKHLELNPQSAQGYFQCGLSLLALERFPDAANAFEQATKLKPDFGPAYFNRGVALARVGDLTNSVPFLRQSLRHNPERLDSYLFLAEVHLRLADFDQAKSILERANSVNPDDPRLKALRARLERAR
jgi:tetratricopeptide (TPR) repeat protein